MNYTSSIINKYGDTENVKVDVKTLNDIINRQGIDLLIDVISSFTGEQKVFRLVILTMLDESKARDIANKVGGI